MSTLGSTHSLFSANYSFNSENGGGAASMSSNFQKQHQDLGLTGGFGSTSTTYAAYRGEVKKKKEEKGDVQPSIFNYNLYQSLLFKSK